MKLRSLSSALLIGIMMSVCMANGAVAQSKPASMSMSDSNKAVLRMFYDEVVNKKDMAAFDKFTNTTFVDHQEMPGYTPDYAGARKFFTDMLTGFPDMKATVDVIVAEGDLVSAQTTWTGTHKGDFMGAPASGKSITFKVMDIVRIKDGKAVEHWGVSEDLAIMTQLGLIHMGH